MDVASFCGPLLFVLFVLFTLFLLPLIRLGLKRACDAHFVAQMF